jgi:hypothetical protein
VTEPVRDYELRAFFSHVVHVLERLSIPYMVVGGFAAIFYGEPRLTLDVDVVIDMKPNHIPSFVDAFPIATTMSVPKPSVTHCGVGILSMSFSRAQEQR